jgi:hypothetical protein
MRLLLEKSCMMVVTIIFKSTKDKHDIEHKTNLLDVVYKLKRRVNLTQRVQLCMFKDSLLAAQLTMRISLFPKDKKFEIHLKIKSSNILCFCFKKIPKEYFSKDNWKDQSW